LSAWFRRESGETQTPQIFRFPPHGPPSPPPIHPIDYPLLLAPECRPVSTHRLTPWLFSFLSQFSPTSLGTSIFPLLDCITLPKKACSDPLVPIHPPPTNGLALNIKRTPVTSPIQFSFSFPLPPEPLFSRPLPPPPSSRFEATSAINFSGPRRGGDVFRSHVLCSPVPNPFALLLFLYPLLLNIESPPRPIPFLPPFLLPPFWRSIYAFLPFIEVFPFLSCLSDNPPNSHVAFFPATPPFPVYFNPPLSWT